MNADPASSVRESPPVGTAAQQKAATHHTELLQQLQAQSERALEPARNLRGYIEAQMRAALDRPKHKYSVFRTGSPRRFMVLRDVDELNGEQPVGATDDFASALNLSHQRMLDPVAVAPGPPHWGAMMESLHQLARTLAEIETGNARIAGAGTIDDPYAVSSGGIFATAPVVLGFPSVALESAKLMASGHYLAVAPPIPPP